MEVEILDLEEFSEGKAVYAKLGEYKINVNDIPLKVALKVNDYYKSLKNDKEIDSQSLIKDIVFPVIQKQNENVKIEEIENKFNYDQLAKLLNMIFTSFLTAGGDYKNNNSSADKDKKKEETKPEERK